MFKTISVACMSFALLCSLAFAQPKGIVGTGNYVVTVANPAFKSGAGPRVLIDEAHNNYQTMDDRFKGFADLLSADGARVKPLRERLSAQTLAEADILVICNALNEKNSNEKRTKDKWLLPAPEAFTEDEIKAVRDWVNAGGSLLLIADHMPFPGAAEKLGDAFGVVMLNNFAFDAAFTYKPGDMNLIKFYRQPGTPNVGKLRAHSVIDGINEGESIPFVVSFTGNAFRMRPGIEFAPILELGRGSRIAWPSDHVDISMQTPFASAEGLYQGVVLQPGKGRVAVFGEASMFSVNYAEWMNDYPTGFHNLDAPHNKQFILNLAHWLAKRIK